MGATLNHRQHKSWDHSVAPRASHALSDVIFTMSLASFLSQPEVAELPRAKIKTKGLQGTATNKDSPSHACLSCSNKTQEAEGDTALTSWVIQKQHL